MQCTHPAASHDFGSYQAHVIVESLKSFSDMRTSVKAGIKPKQASSNRGGGCMEHAICRYHPVTALGHSR